MFKNRTLQMKVIDDRKPEHPMLKAAHTNPPETVIIEVVRESSIYIAGLFGVYITADTIRKIAIHIATTKIK